MHPRPPVSVSSTSFRTCPQVHLLSRAEAQLLVLCIPLQAVRTHLQPPDATAFSCASLRVELTLQGSDSRPARLIGAASILRGRRDSPVPVRYGSVLVSQSPPSPVCRLLSRVGHAHRIPLASPHMHLFGYRENCMVQAFDFVGGSGSDLSS
ncbi:hypothetical protein GY45DRAFT_602265 [Cubamyces sp. BRFM 1775]|nr:hypothetical protein GY45DRAFT_602265 [Cubamyces sp. BRFM 1775]